VKPAPFVKWIGGKRKLAHEIVNHIRPFTHYCEPMCGGAAVFWQVFNTPRLHTGAEHYTLHDANDALLLTYRCIRQNWRAVHAQIQKLPEKGATNDEDAYYEMRKAFNTKRQTPYARAALFLYLNRACYNGLWRVNRAGHFNAAFGKYRKLELPTAELLEACSHALQRAALPPVHLDVADAGPGHCVYLDPPYDDAFNSYTAERDSGDTLQEWVHATAQKAASRGAQVLVSNADTPRIRALWQGPGWRIVELTSNYSVRPHSLRKTKQEQLILRI